MSASHEEMGFRPEPPDDEDEEAWDNKDLGASAEHVRKSSREREDEVDEKLGLKMISIRLQAELIEKMKTLAEQDGIGYQPLIRQVLNRYANEKL